MSLNQLLGADLTEDRVEISIGRSALITALKAHEDWPTHQSGRPLRIIDEDEFLEGLCNYLVTEDIDGISPLHHAFNEAAKTMLEDGSDAVENEHSIGSDGFASDDERDDDVDEDEDVRELGSELGWGSGNNWE